MTVEKQRILIVEDDPDIANVEKVFLEANNFEVVIETDGLKGQERTLNDNFSLIILDLNLPRKSGMTICKEIREKVNVPILIVTASIEDIDIVQGFGLGADDYITKPFSNAELVARVKSHIARYSRFTQNTSHSTTSNELYFGSMRIDPDAYKVHIDDTEITLTTKEFDLLYYLANNKGNVLSKEQIYDKIWGEGTYGELETVKVYINRIREKIEKNPSKPDRIQTVWGAGYRFVG